VAILVPVLRSVAARSPFQPGSTRRLAGLAAVLLLVGWLGPVLSGLSTIAVISRLGLDESLTWSITIGVLPLLLAALLLILAEAFRRGEQISRDVDGLV
jgi:TRAP-type C4-dicarboxylate transport system permease small subunit